MVYGIYAKEVRYCTITRTLPTTQL